MRDKRVEKLAGDVYDDVDSLVMWAGVDDRVDVLVWLVRVLQMEVLYLGAGVAQFDSSLISHLDRTHQCLAGMVDERNECWDIPS